MSGKAVKAFEAGIRDAEALLEYFEAIQSADHPSNKHAEVLKRAGLIMAMTAWETYVEDRLEETLEDRLKVLNGSSVSSFIRRRFAADIKQLHNPTSDKVKKLFTDYLDVDVTEGWLLTNLAPNEARKRLDALLSKRGEVVHRSKVATANPAGDVVKKSDLEKAIRFLKELVTVTEKYLAEKP
jgi:hypothetical protein